MKSSVLELIERVIELARSYAIWWELVNVENRAQRERDIQAHEDFFGATAHAHFQAIVVVLYQLFDRNRTTKSIPNLLRRFEATDPGAVAKIKQDVAPHWLILKKVFDIRGNVYAHRNGSLSPEDVFARANLSANALGALVSVAEDAVATLGALASIDSREELIAEFERRADFARGDLRLVFVALAKHPKEPLQKSTI